MRRAGTGGITNVITRSSAGPKELTVMAITRAPGRLTATTGATGPVITATGHTIVLITAARITAGLTTGRPVLMLAVAYLSTYLYHRTHPYRHIRHCLNIAADQQQVTMFWPANARQNIFL